MIFNLTKKRNYILADSASYIVIFTNAIYFANNNIKRK